MTEAVRRGELGDTRDALRQLAKALDARDALIAQLGAALEVALNYWEPRCSGGDCDKGYHNDEFRAHKTARAALAAAAQARKGETGK